MSFCFIMAQETLSWQREGLSRRHTRRYCGNERGSTMAAREALSSRQRIKRDPRETVSRWHARLHHGSRKMPIIAADSILQRQGETISRRHERGCVLSGSGESVSRRHERLSMSNRSRRAYHGGTSDSMSIMPRGQTVSRRQESFHVHRGS